MTTMRGIDVSEHQGNIDWAKVKSGGAVEFAILRAGYGKYVKQKDKKFEHNYAGCVENNIPCGAYWFSYATNPSEAKQEASCFIEILKGKKFQMPVYIDIEDSQSYDKSTGLKKYTVKYTSMPQKQLCEIAQVFCNELEKAGYFCGIYSYRSLMNMFDDYTKNRYAAWIAELGKDNYKYQHGMWQHSWTGKIDGISGDVDMDECYVDYPSIMKQRYLNGYRNFDVNSDGLVTMLDASMVLKEYANGIASGERPDVKYDVNGDGDVNEQDVIRILRLVAEIE